MGAFPGPANQPAEAKALNRPRRATVTPSKTSFFDEAQAEHERRLQNRTSDFLLRAYGVLLAATLLIFFLQGFALWGFHLEETTLHWIGAATVGQTAGLLALAIRSIFRGKNKA